LNYLQQLAPDQPPHAAENVSAQDAFDEQHGP
jgi:hypothetical protein